MLPVGLKKSLKNTIATHFLVTITKPEVCGGHLKKNFCNTQGALQRGAQGSPTQWTQGKALPSPPGPIYAQK